MAKTLFHDLLWPAAAGNVAWAFFSFLLGTPAGPHDYVSRLVTLAALAAYLGFDWQRCPDKENVKTSYWVFDGLLLAALTAFAIAIATCKPVDTLRWWAVGTLVVAGVGHLMAMWERSERRYLKTAVMACGAVAVGPAWPVLADYPVVQIPIVTVCVLVLWYCVIRWPPPPPRSA